jgi:hypothetical protein
MKSLYLWLLMAASAIAAGPVPVQHLSQHMSGKDWEDICRPFSYESGQGVATIFCGFRIGADKYITAKHCIEGNGWGVGSRIKLVGGHTAEIIWVTDEEDGVVVMHLSRRVDPVGFIAKTFPKVGEQVMHVGWPLGNELKSNFGPIVKDEGEYAVTRATLYSGYSGGPVCDMNGHIVGVNLATFGRSSTDPETSPQGRGAYIATVRQIRRALNEIGYDPDADYSGPKPEQQVSRKRRLIIFGIDGCDPCMRTRSETQGQEGVTYINAYSGAPEIAAYEKATGQTLSRFPTYWVEGTPETKVGYESPRSLLGWVMNTLKGFGELIVGSPRDRQPPRQSPTPPAAAPTPPAAPQPAPLDPAPQPIDPARYARALPPQVHPDDAKAAEDIRAAIESAERLEAAKNPPREPDPEIDWTGVRVLVAASTDVTSAARYAEGPAKRGLQHVTGGKAEILVVAERTHPSTFQEYSQIVGVDPEPLHVTILIPKTDQGLARGLIIKKAQDAISGFRDHLPDSVRSIPFEVIFERTNRDDYERLRDIAVQADEDRESSDEGGHKGLLVGLIHAVALWIGRKVSGGASNSAATFLSGVLGRNNDGGAA